MSFEDVEIPVKVTYDSADLKRLIKDFDGSTEAAERLRDATKQVKLSIDSQARAIGAFNQSQRINNFQMVESLRLLRTFTSTFSSLNQVYQTILLKQISHNTQSIKQSEAYERIKGQTTNLVNALDILGASNADVKAGFEDLFDSADNLDSTQIETLITTLETLKTSGNLSTEELAFLNAEISKLKKLLDETKLEEKNKEFQDFFGTFTTAATAAGSLGTFALQMTKFAPALRGAVSILARFAPEIALIIVLLYGKDVAIQLGLLQMTGEEDLTDMPLDKLKEQNMTHVGDSKSFFDRIGNPQDAPYTNSGITNTFNIEKVDLTTEADLYKWADRITELQNQKRGQGIN